MSSSNTLKKKKGHHKNYNRPDVLPSGMLDAYVDTEASSENGSKVISKPVSTKNKNKKKLEQRKMEEAAKEKEVKSQPEEVVILDSWEDIDPDFEPKETLNSNCKPKTLVSTPSNPHSDRNSAKSPLPATKSKEEVKKKPPVTVDSETKNALARLNETISKMSSLFIEDKEAPKKTSDVKMKETTPLPKDTTQSSNQGKSENKSDVKKTEKSSSPSSDKNQNKSKEEIKAEREAKKAAKAARRAAAKGDAEPAGAPSAKPPPSAPPLQKSEDEALLKKSNAELKAERRAKQEAQRAAKAAAAQAAKAPPKVTSSSSSNTNSNCTHSTKANPEEKKVKKKASVTAEVIPTTKSNHRKVMLFSHLPIYERNSSFKCNFPLVNGDIHPVIMQLGLQYSMGTISGSNARCVSLMHALKRVISDYVTPPQKELSRDLDASLKPYINFLTTCRTLSVSMENALRYVRTKIRKIDHSMSDDEAKNQLLEDIDEFILVNIVLASKQISMTAREKIKDGDVILTYGHSSLVRSVFVYAAQSGVNFRVIVADSRPKFEGKEMARHLVNAGIKCTYVLISAVPYIIREVSKVILGASSILANGTVNSRVGTSQVALIAKACNVPVLVCCETYKFSERVQTDSFVFNELGDPNDLVSPGDPHEDWKNIPKLNLLNLNYDITPASLVDAIISEISVIPGTSVPVVLRLKNSETNIK